MLWEEVIQSNSELLSNYHLCLVDLTGETDDALLDFFIQEGFIRIPCIAIVAHKNNQSRFLAFGFQPLAIILSPFTKEQLTITIEYALYSVTTQQNANVADKPLVSEALASDAAPDAMICYHNCVYIKSKYKYIRVLFVEITFLEAAGNFTYIHTRAGKHIVRLSLMSALDVLGRIGIVRIHRSYAVHMSKVESFDEQHCHIGKHPVPFGRNYKQAFLAALRSGDSAKGPMQVDE